MGNVVGRIMTPKMSMSSSPDGKWQKGLYWCDWRSWSREIVLGYLGGSDIIIGVFISGRQWGIKESVVPDRSVSSTITKNPSSWVLTNKTHECSWGTNFSKFLIMFIVFEHDIKYLKCTNASCKSFMYLYTRRIKENLEAINVTVAEWGWSVSRLPEGGENHR